MARRKIVAGNWKMNMTPSQAVKLVEELKPLVASDSVDVVYCVPAIDIVPVVEACKGTNVAVGAENMYFEEKGAYTGEISAEMLVDAGVKYVIIGHSERRDYFKEDDALLNKKVKKAIEAGLIPILCCGESLEQREMGVTMDWIRLQIKSIIGVDHKTGVQQFPDHMHISAGMFSIPVDQLNDSLGLSERSICPPANRMFPIR